MSRLRLLPWLLALIAVSLAGLFWQLNARWNREVQAAVRETLSAREAMAETLSLLTDAETGVRGFAAYKSGEDGQWLTWPMFGRRLTAKVTVCSDWEQFVADGDDFHGRAVRDAGRRHFEAAVVANTLLKLRR